MADTICVRLACGEGAEGSGLTALERHWGARQDNAQQLEEVEAALGGCGAEPGEVRVPDIGLFAGKAFIITD
jgi:hypothetical protein